MQNETQERRAPNNDSIYSYRSESHAFLKRRGREGATLDELAQHLTEFYGTNVPNKVAKARLTELKSRGQAVSSGMKRTTRFGEQAEVVILKEFEYAGFSS